MQMCRTFYKRILKWQNKIPLMAHKQTNKEKQTKNEGEFSDGIRIAEDGAGRNKKIYDLARYSFQENFFASSSLVQSSLDIRRISKIIFDCFESTKCVTDSARLPWLNLLILVRFSA